MGVEVKTTKPGDGATFARRPTVVVHYTGTLTNGKVRLEPRPRQVSARSERTEGPGGARRGSRDGALTGDAWRDRRSPCPPRPFEFVIGQGQVIKVGRSVAKMSGRARDAGLTRPAAHALRAARGACWRLMWLMPTGAPSSL